jgi:hypothetical protein
MDDVFLSLTGRSADDGGEDIEHADESDEAMV